MRRCSNSPRRNQHGVLLALLVLSVIASAASPSSAQAQANDLADAIKAVLSVKTDGSGSAAAAVAFPVLANATPDQLPTLLAALDDANPLAANWIYGSIDAIVGRAERAGDSLSAEQMHAFASDPSHSPRARERAYMLLQKTDAGMAETMVAGFLYDPSPIFRRQGVANLIEEANELAEGGQEDQAQELYERAYNSALDEDQVNDVAKKLVDAGKEVDLPRKFGYLTHWRLIGPFDNPENGAFDKAYPPEELTLDNYNGENGIHSDVTFEGKLGEVSWKDFATGEDNGEVNLNVALAEEPAAIGYGATIYTSDEARDAELRLRIQNAFKVWVNGELVMAQPIGHTGNFFDQYTVPVKLRQGPNLILVKSVQIEPPMANPWFSAWQFCVRVSDETGAALLASDRPPTPEKDAVDAEDGDGQ